MKLYLESVHGLVHVLMKQIPIVRIFMQETGVRSAL